MVSFKIQYAKHSKSRRFYKTILSMQHANDSVRSLLKTE